MESRSRLPCREVVCPKMVMKKNVFIDAFRKAQLELGLVHYAVHFEECEIEHLAEIQTQAEDCVAKVRYNQKMMDEHKVVETTAVHECIHLLLADFEYALEENPKGAQLENERVVRRLEPILARGLGFHGNVK